MRRAIAVIVALVSLAGHVQAQSTPPATKPATRPVAPKPVSHTIRVIEGWTVHVDDRLLAGADKQLGERAVVLLSEHLKKITGVMPPDKLARLKEVHIYLDRTHGGLRSAQYHPSKGWLRNNGYAEALARCVHIPDAKDFVSPRLQHDQPWMVLHELAHAYHDQMLGFEEPRIKSAWKKLAASGKYESVLHVNGRMTRHYALTDQKEFFAEMSESFFGRNDFFPFDAKELAAAEPEIFKLLEEVWGRGPTDLP